MGKRLSVFAVLLTFILSGCVPAAHMKQSPSAARFSAPSPLPVSTKFPFYRIVAQYNPDTHRIRGSAAITWKHPGPNSLNEVVFRLFPNGKNGKLEIEKVLVLNKPASFSTGGTVLTVSLPRPLSADETVSLQIEFSTQLPAGNGTLAYDRDVVALGNWYPQLAPFQKGGWYLPPFTTVGDPYVTETADYQVELTFPEGWNAASSAGEGILLSKQDGWQTMHFAANGIRDFAFSLSPSYGMFQLRAGDTLVNSYYLSRNLSGGTQAANYAAAALLVFEQLFGPYPLSSLSVAESTNWTGGMEYPGVVFIGQPLYLNPSMLEQYVVHEVAHQWWYGVVGNDQYAEPWLDEALAQYSVVLYYEKEYGPEFGQKVLAGMASRYREFAGRGGKLFISGNLSFYEHHPDWYTIAVYYRGPLFIAELRKTLDDERFFAVLRQYVQEYGHKIAAGENFLQLVGRAAGKDLSPLYATYLGESYTGR